MSEYTAPVKDMQFVLKHLAGLNHICQLPGFEEADEEVIDAVLEEAAKFASGELAPLNTVGDANAAVVVDKQVKETQGFKQAYDKFVEGGWVSLPCSAQYGGMGLPECIGATAMEMWTSANMSFALCPMLGQGAIAAIENHASETLKDTYLEKLACGQWTGTMNLTEPQAGSDLAEVRTKAVREGDHYRLSGTKIYITWGDHQMTDNVVHLVLARTPDAPAGVKGISLFVVPKFLVNGDGSLGARNDVYAVSVEHKMGIHASPTCVMSFGETEGAIGYLVGEENHGLAYMFTMMNHARLNVGVQGVAISDRAYQKAVGYARERVQGKAVGDSEKGPIIRHADIRRMLMLMKSLTEASRALCYVTAAEFDLAHHATDDTIRNNAVARGDLLTPLAKAWSTEIAQEVTSLGVQIHGGMGFVEETGAAQFMRDARITTIYEGTTGIQANDFIGRKILRDGGAAFSQLMSDIHQVQAQLNTDDESQNIIAEALVQGSDSLQLIVDKVLESNTQDPQFSTAVAFNVLMAAGTVAGAWLMARAAIVASNNKDEDPEFYQAKLVTARFYAEHVCPRVDSYVKTALAGSESMMALADDQF